MKAFYLLIIFIFGSISCLAQSYPCLSPNVNGDDLVSVKTVTSRSGKESLEKVTVKQTLKKLGARCVRGKLVDTKSREIRVYYVKSCWGNPPDNYLELQDREEKELARLRKLYTLIEMKCDRTGIPPA